MDFRFLGLLFLGCFWMQQAFSEEQNGVDVQQLLRQCAHSMKSTNYRGEFTLERDGRISTLQVSHAVFDGKEYESVKFLNGIEQGVVRKDRDESCF